MPVTAGAEPVVARRGDGVVADAVALSASVAINAVVGAACWFLAAKLLPQATVGTASAFISAFMLVAAFAQLNVGVGLLRWLPHAGRRASTLVWRCTAATLGCSVLLASGYLLLPGSDVIFAAGTGSSGASLGGWAVFVLAATGWSLLQLQDFVLVGLRRPWWAPATNAVAVTARLAILVAAGAALSAQVLVLAWLVPTALCVLGISIVIAVAGPRPSVAGGEPVAGELPTRREVLGFLGPGYLGQIGAALLYLQVPLLVILRFGPSVGAAFFVIWQAITVVDVLAMRFANSMVGQLARFPERADELARVSRRRLLAVFLPGVAAGLVLAEPALSLVGPGYAPAAVALQILLAGLGFRLLVVHAQGLRQALGDGAGFARLQVAGTALVLAAVLLVPAPAGGGTAEVLVPIAVAYLAVQVGCAVPQVWPRGPSTVPAIRRRIASRSVGRHRPRAVRARGAS